MKRLITLIGVLLFANLPLIPTASSHAQDTSDVPYIYYYSEVLNSFVVERADGTDPHLLGADLMPEDPAGINGAGWSPSGEWLAWRVWNGDFGIVRNLPFAINIDGTRRLTSLDEFITAELKWSPNPDLLGDILMVTGLVGEVEIDPETNMGTTTIRTAFIDVETDSVLYSHDIPDYPIAYTFDEDGEPVTESLLYHVLHWTNDGEYAIQKHDEVTYGVNGTVAAGGIQIVHTVFDQNGVVNEFTFNEAEILADFGWQNELIRNGKVAYVPITDRNKIIIHDIIQDEPLEITVDNLRMWGATFSPDADAALMMGQDADCESDCPYSLWLWQAGQTELTLVLDDADWNMNRGSMMWSPDGAYAIAVDTDFVPVMLDLATATVSQLEDVPNAVHWDWQSDSEVLIGTTGDVGTIYHVDLASNTLQHTLTRREASEFYQIGALSPDKASFAYVAENPVIQDTESGAEIDIRPDGRSYFSIKGGEAYWSADGEWVLLAEEALIAGGNAPRWTNIVKADGTMRRELGRFGSPTIFGWLPENVDVSSLPAVGLMPLFPTPDTVLHASEFSFILSWSPDGSHIVRGAQNLGGELGASTLFDVTTGAMIGELEPMNFEINRVAWTENEDGSFTPEIIDQPVPSGNFGTVVFATSPDGTLSAEYGTEAGDEIAIYDVETGEMLHSEYRLGMAAVSFNPDNSLVVISSPYAPTYLYDGNTWQPILTFNTHASAVAFSPDGETLALANAWDLELYNVAELLSMAN